MTRIAQLPALCRKTLLSTTTGSRSWLENFVAWRISAARELPTIFHKMSRGAIQSDPTQEQAGALAAFT